MKNVAKNVAKNIANRTLKTAACTLVAAASFLTTATAPAHAQDKAALMAKGEKVYKAYCQTCHQANGKGLSTIYPSIAGSDYIKAKGLQDVVDGVVNGRSGEMIVDGKKYNGVMAPIPASYTDEDVAAVVTFVMNSWGNPGGIATLADVKKARKAKAGASKRVKA
jgi:mono/diheme cytochrome c family protein